MSNSEYLKEAMKYYNNREFYDEKVKSINTYKQFLPGCNVKFAFNSNTFKFWLVGSFLLFAIAEKGLLFIKELGIEKGLSKIEIDEEIQFWRKYNRQTEFIYQQLRNLC